MRKFKQKMDGIRHNVEDNLLADINREAEVLISQCEDKENEINALKEYAQILQEDIEKIAE